MNQLDSSTSTGLADVARLVGRQRGDEPGPLLIVLGGIHGNEPAGVLAARRVLDRLSARSFVLRGELVALAGNVRALREGLRYKNRDLNRMWTEERIAEVREAMPQALEAESLELRELLGALEEELKHAKGPVFFIDLHTTSAAGIPFCLIGDTLRNRQFASYFPLPLILGLEEQVDGVILEFMSGRGAVTFGIEGGQHQAESSIDALEASIWIGLAAAGMVDPREQTDHDAAWRLLNRARHGLPRVMEVVQRHAIKPEHRFRMEPGFANIDPVKRRDLLAADWRGEIRAKTDGYVFLPLYQGLGDDGFFFGREVPAWAMRLSALLRRIHADRLIGWLPGVSAVDVAGDTLRVNTRIARLYPVQIFHLAGFRKIRQMGRSILFQRRRS